jgi:FdhD protein
MSVFHKIFHITNYLPDGIEEHSSKVIIESSVDISINAKYWLSLMCTPSNLDELAIGFLYNEGLINSFDEIKMVEVCHNGSNIDIWLNHDLKIPKKWQRTSGCTGGTTSVMLNNSCQTKLPPTKISSSKIPILLDMLLDSQNLYAMSGGVHSSVLSDGKKMLIVMEDIGRHNTLDKIAGHCLMGIGFPTTSILISTGRISSEMLQKAARIGSAIVISRTSPSSLSIELADQLGICIIGYARKDRFKVYSHPEYVVPSI